MISFEEAYRIVLQQTPRPVTVILDLSHALGHVLAERVPADMDVPPFDRAIMDGVALRASDLLGDSAELEIVGEIAAGASSSLQLGPGQTAQIMTGAAMPAGADAVQMIENVQIEGQKARVKGPVRVGDRVMPRASEVTRGHVVLEIGRHIGPAETAVLAMFGKTRMTVYAKPNVAILATGNELVPPSQNPGPTQIRNSNSEMLAAQLRVHDIRPKLLGIARDDVDELERRIAAGLDQDVLLLTGGVSAGKYDLIVGVLQKLGVEIFFDRVAIKPGKPVTFGRRNETLVFGLPGNPVSAFVSFETLVAPAIRKRQGFSFFGPFRIDGRLESPFRKSGDRALFAPANVRNDAGWKVKPVETKGSADIWRFSSADALLYLEKETTELAAGSSVVAFLLPDYFNRYGHDTGVFSPG